jgi:hypothetical protein
MTLKELEYAYNFHDCYVFTPFEINEDCVTVTFDLAKHNVLRNLFGKSDVTKLYNYRGEAQYDRIHQKTKIVTHMTPEHRVKTIHKVHKPHKEIEKRRKAGVLIEKRKKR